jgi:hypothetical protein
MPAVTSSQSIFFQYIIQIFGRISEVANQGADIELILIVVNKKARRQKVNGQPSHVILYVGVERTSAA